MNSQIVIPDFLEMSLMSQITPKKEVIAAPNTTWDRPSR